MGQISKGFDCLCEQFGFSTQRLMEILDVGQQQLVRQALRTEPLTKFDWLRTMRPHEAILPRVKDWTKLQIGQLPIRPILVGTSVLQSQT